MRLATIRTQSGPRLHVKAAQGYVDVATATGEDEYVSLIGVLRAGESALSAIRPLTSQTGVDIAPEQFAPAVPDATRILCLGVNYSEHALEGGRDVPSWPECFIKTAGTILGPFDDLAVPALSDALDYEAELGVVIGKGGRYIKAADAPDAIAGYVALNDVSAREWQRAMTQWTPGKNFDASMPIGPEVVTSDEIDIADIRVQSILNGQVMQSASTAEMIVTVNKAVEYFSSFTELRPGDVIATGTPGGVGFARKPPVWMKPGDLIEVTIEGVGSIRNKVVAEKGAPVDWPWHPNNPWTEWKV